MLDLERAREDCWVTFKAGKSLNFDDMDMAMSSIVLCLLTLPDTCSLERIRSERSQVVTKAFFRHTRRSSENKERKKVHKYFSIQNLIVDLAARIWNWGMYFQVKRLHKLNIHSLIELSEKEVSINMDDLIGSGSRANIYKGAWRGVEVSVKIPTKEVPTDKFIANVSKA